MRVLIVLLAMALSSCGAKEQAGAPLADPLEQARALAEQGKYEEALRKHIWVHDHILEKRPSYYGVRLSYALDDWIDLGRKYPRALKELKSIRDKKTARLIGGESDRHLFHDVVAINEHLTEPSATVDLFSKLDSTQPRFAASVYELAEEALTARHEYALAKKYLGDPVKRLASARQQFEQGMQYSKTSSAREASQQAFENIFAEKVVRIITILQSTGDGDQAKTIQSEALKVLDSPRIKNATRN